MTFLHTQLTAGKTADIKDRLDAKLRVLENGSATPLLGLNRPDGSFKNGWCYLELFPGEYLMSAALLLGQNPKLDDVLDHSIVAWGGDDLFIGNSAGWRLSFGTQAKTPLGFVLAHLDRTGGTLTFDQLSCVLGAARGKGFLIGGDNEERPGGGGVPSSPPAAYSICSMEYTARDAEEVHWGNSYHRRSSTSSSVMSAEVALYDAGDVALKMEWHLKKQEEIDNISRPFAVHTKSFVKDWFEGQIKLVGWQNVTERVVHSLALSFKATHGCPIDHMEMNINRTKKHIKFCHKDHPHLGEKKGLFIWMDYQYWYHTGDASVFRAQANFWRLAFKSIKSNPSAANVRALSSELSQKTYVRCTNPWFDKQLLGFRVCASLDGCNIYSRGMDFSRPDGRPGHEGLVTVRQYKLFWDIGDRRLVFTAKGLAKMFYRKKEHEKWRYAISRAIGMTLSSAYRFFSHFTNLPSEPDLVFADEGENPYSAESKVVVKNVFVEVPIGRSDPKEGKPVIEVLKSPTPEVSPPPPPPPVTPVKESTLKPAKALADGDSWLLKPGMEGKSNRSVFRSTFENDWHLRVSANALTFMNQDVSAYGERTHHFKPDSLIVDPSVKFDIHAKRFSPRRVPKSNSPSAMTGSDVLGQIVKLGQSKLRKSAGGADPRDAYLLAKQKEFAVPKNHKDARDSTMADVETNPGPTLSENWNKVGKVMNDDDLLINHPTPSDFSKFKHRRAASDMMHNSNRLSLAFTDTGSPLDDRFFVTEATPVYGVPYSFKMPRSASESDIEVNPGPQPVSKQPDRGRSPGPADDGKKGNFLDATRRALSRSPSPRREPERSRSRSISGAVSDALHFRQNFQADLQETFGFKRSSVAVGIADSALVGGWVKKNYDSHFIVGYLPTSNQWSYKPPGVFAAAGIMDLQNSIDRLNVVSNRACRSQVASIMDLVNTFFTRADPDYPVNATLISALAHAIKSKWACPGINEGYALSINTDVGAIIWSEASVPNTSVNGRLWWLIGDSRVVHGGIPDKAKVRARLFLNDYSGVPSGDVEGSLWDQTCHIAEVKAVRAGWAGQLKKTQAGLDEFHFDNIQYILVYYVSLVYFSFVSLAESYDEYVRPNFRETSANVHFTEDDYRGSTSGKELYMATFGTYGDKIPVHYLANVAGHLGIATTVRNYKTMNLEGLARLKQGDFGEVIPDYMSLSYCDKLGYKAVFVPHIEVPLSAGVSYSLQPTTKWIRKIRYVNKWTPQNIIRYPMVDFAERIAQVFNPLFRLGVTSECALPRSANGLSLLSRTENKRTGKIGWVCGSADKSVIPLTIREEYEEITDPNHTRAFACYDVIHMHGGAGTVQTAISCGARPVVHDVNLDRDYHTIPTSEDFKQPDLGAFLGWLLFMRFDFGAPRLFKAYWILKFLLSIKMVLLSRALFFTIKACTLTFYLMSNWMSFAIFFFSVPTIGWRMLAKSDSLFLVAKAVLAFAWEYPYFLLIDRSLFSVGLFFLVSKLWHLVSQDMLLMSAKAPNHFVVFEPVERQGFVFRFPFGHWCLYDGDTKTVYEGRFTTNLQGLGYPFKFTSVQRGLRPGARRFKAGLQVISLEQMVTGSEEQPYSTHHNCVTLVMQGIAHRSLVWTLTMFSLGCVIALALLPSDILRGIIDFLSPSTDVRESPLYHTMGFAAGIENIPFEHEDEGVSTPFVHEVSPHPSETDWSQEGTFDGLVAEIATIQRHVRDLNLPSIDDDDLVEVGERVFAREVEKVEIPFDSLVTVQALPPYVKHTWAEIVDGLHHAISFVRGSDLLSGFVAWLKTIEHNVLDFMGPILEMTSYVLSLAYTLGKGHFKTMFEAMCHFLDHTWGLEASNRVKTVWGLTGLHRTGMLGIKARLAANIAYSDYIGRNDFESDYARLVEEAKKWAAVTNATGRGKIGGPQHRKIGYSKPIMTHKEASLLGFGKDEYVTEDSYQNRVESYLQEGVRQGADGVFLADKIPELIAKSQHRYEPKYPDLNSDDRQFAKEIAQAMFDHNPEVFADADIVPPSSVHAYVKTKYSPGTPFINGRGFKSRQAIFDAGYDKVLQRRARDYLESGKYPVQFYHAFVKSQVVDIEKCLPVDKGGKGKDVRTVVSQDLFSYYIEQCCQIERNKRINWDTYGAGIGMPLNQSMEVIYDRMANHQKSRGGRYIVMDGHAFDSGCKPFLFEVGSCLWELGFKDHPSGNGHNIASVIRASYEARQNAWIIGITEPEYRSLTISVPDPAVRNRMSRAGLPNLVPLDTLLNMKEFEKLSAEGKRTLVENLVVPQDKTIMTWDPALRPKASNWMGSYEIGDPTTASKTFFERQTLLYPEDDLAGMTEDIRRVANSNYRLMSNVHPKNRGGSTGGSDTSNVNTHAFKAGVIYAWCMTTGRRPSEFFEFNDLANTSDDTIWQSGGKWGLNTVEDIETFRQHALDVGMDLEIDTTKDINKVEYLSKFVRTPTADDSATLQAWRSARIASTLRSYKDRGFDKPDLEGKFSNPRFVVVQNPSAILLRRSAFRYYQSSMHKWRYVSIERGSGHANNTAFVPPLYAKFALEWCEDVNVLLEQQNIHRKFRFTTNGQFNLPCVEQVDPRSSQQALSPRQKAFLEWLKGNMYPSYYKVIDIHMNVSKVDPEQHSKLLRKLERGWRGWDEILKEGVDGLFAATDSIPDEWCKKFQPGVSMLYAEQPFYTKNKIVEKFIYLKLLEESPDNVISFADFSTRVQESPYGAACDPYHFWEQLQDESYKAELLAQEPVQYQGLVLLISALYMLTSTAEWTILGFPIVGVLYKLFLWTFVGLNKVYGITNTAYWHSTGKSSREISRIMPRDPYASSKRFCAFVVDFLPLATGYVMLVPCLLLDVLPPMLDCIGKTWFKGAAIKESTTPNLPGENPWSSYSDEYIERLRASPTKRAYVAAKTGTGKSSMFVAALWASRFRQRVRKIWVVQPRKVLRDETVVPFGIPSQPVKRGVAISPSTDIYFLTYGHLQTRLLEIDIENDIVLFDEFHEQQGEMILGLDTCKAPIFLLSATPAEIPALEGSDFLSPNIDRRFGIQIHPVDDSMEVVDMFMEAQNRYPELMDRALIIVPTYKKLNQTIEALNYLKVGKVSPLTARNRSVPTEGIIVSTPYVQTGLDIKPPPKILIDCGRDIVFDKGKMVRPFPFTNRDINQQRIGRVGRLAPGVVFQPVSAGTGVKAVTYPTPNQFMHASVASHFKVPELRPQRGAVMADLPFMVVNTDLLTTTQIVKSVVFIHAIALSGVRQTEWKKFYTMKVEGKTMDEDHEYLDRIYNNARWAHCNLLPYDLALYHLNRQGVVNYNIAGSVRWCKPMTVLNGTWMELEESPTNDISIEPVLSTEDSPKYVTLQRHIDKVKFALMTQASQMGPEHFDKASAILTF
ncbi:MAG: polyprotein [Apis hypovirus 3]|nr:MAG: polyprotein [Apis hypovirus 3]